MLAWQPCLGELGTVPQSSPMMAPYLQKWLTPQIRHQHDGPETGDVPVPPQNHCSRGPNIYHQSSPCSPDLFSSSFQLISSRLFMERLDTIQQEQNHLPNTWEKNRHRSAPTLSSSACPPHQGSKRCPSSCQKQTPGKGLSCKGNQNIVLIYRHFGASQVAQLAKNLPAKQETQVWSLGQEDPLEKRVATHSSILAWIIPWTEKPGRLYSMESQRVRHDWVTNTHTHTHTHTHRHLKKNSKNKATPSIQQVQEGCAEPSPISFWKQKRTPPPPPPWNMSFIHWKENDIDCQGQRVENKRILYKHALLNIILVLLSLPTWCAYFFTITPLCSTQQKSIQVSHFSGSFVISLVWRPGSHKTHGN